jgi:ubiquitin-protein ligase
MVSATRLLLYDCGSRFILFQSVPPAVMRRVMRELNELEKNPPEGIRIQMNDEDMLDVTGIIAGPGE